jgi:hypothetical protein
LSLFALLLIFIASQFFWIGRILDLGERFIPGKPRRAWLAIIAGLVRAFSSHVCLKPLRAFASPRCPTFTSAPS